VRGSVVQIMSTALSITIMTPKRSRSPVSSGCRSTGRRTATCNTAPSTKKRGRITRIDRNGSRPRPLTSCQLTTAPKMSIALCAIFTIPSTPRVRLSPSAMPV